VRCIITAIVKNPQGGPNVRRGYVGTIPAVGCLIYRRVENPPSRGISTDGLGLPPGWGRHIQPQNRDKKARRGVNNFRQRPMKKYPCRRAAEDRNP
jgi:hypothetical protein